MLRVEDVMGTTVVVDVRDDDVPASCLDEVFDWLRVVDETFSTYKPDSEISRLARGELQGRVGVSHAPEGLSFALRFPLATARA